MPSKKNPTPTINRKISDDRNISTGGDVVDSVVIAGDGNKVNIIQKFFNIFKSDAETVDQRNRRIMLGHVENFWVKGILEKSLHGAALLDLGIKEDPDALTYPWAIKREANKETLPAGTSMLEIFQEIGMGRSLLILGAPGSGKTTMLLELTRQLIERARADVTEPIPVVFNLSSWTEKLTLADWLARELNLIYTIPKKVAPTWITENKMLPLLDGLDEVKQESRDMCVNAINQFRKENGLTSMVVCSRIQDYAELKARLSFDGAIEIQPLTARQVNEYFKSFGKGLAGIKQVLEKDTILREMAETPLFLSIMTLAYQDTQSKDILVSQNFDIQRKHLFDTYIERMFERSERSKNEQFKKLNVLRWLAWLAQKISEYDQVPYLIENMQPEWLSRKMQWSYRVIGAMVLGLSFGLIAYLSFGPLWGLIYGVIAVLYVIVGSIEINMVDTLIWDWKQARKRLAVGLGLGLISALYMGLIFGLRVWLLIGFGDELVKRLNTVLGGSLIACLVGGLIFAGLKIKPIKQTILPGQMIYSSIYYFLSTFFITGLIFGLIFGLTGVMTGGLSKGIGFGLKAGLILGVLVGTFFGGLALIQHYSMRYILSKNNLLPWRLTPFLDHCVALIFLRRVGGGYIFVHRLLMEHFAAMYTESE